MLTFHEALETILSSVAPLASEAVDLLSAGGRILARDLLAPWPLPQWDNSAMDGFAVRFDDYSGNGTLPVEGYIPAGFTGTATLRPGTAIRIMTGAPVPTDADTVIPIEDVVEEGESIRLMKPVKKGQHIRFTGEDVALGERVIAAGTLLRPAEVGMLAAFGQREVEVIRRVRVAIVSTGDELVEPGTIPGAGQIVNSNTYILAAALRDIGAEPVIVGIARDTVESHREIFARAFEADAVITSAGVSAGDRDLVKDILGEFGVEQRFWKVNIKPGKPTAFGMRGATPVFSLPGNPVSTLITFDVLARPALLKMMGHREVQRPVRMVRMAERVKKTAGRRHFLRVMLEQRPDGEWATLAGDQNTGIMKTAVRAAALAQLPEEPSVIEAGTEVEVHLL